MAPVYADHPFALIADPRTGDGSGKGYDQFDKAANDMGGIHNCFIRSLNAIYLQAPHIKPEDVNAFCNYASEWCTCLKVHHDGEEAQFFPYVEERCGVPGLMSGNVEQHAAFHDGVEVFDAYVRACADGKQAYDGKHLVGLIDAFGPALVKHLVDEVSSLLALRKYSDKLPDLDKAIAHEGETSMKALSMTAGLPLIFCALDVDFEGGRWNNFPDAPWPLIFLCTNVMWRFHSSWWRFAPCTPTRHMKPLYAVPDTAEPEST